MVACERLAYQNDKGYKVWPCHEEKRGFDLSLTHKKKILIYTELPIGYQQRSLRIYLLCTAEAE